MTEFDFIIVGSGVGLSVLSDAMNAGSTCALVESGKMGGTCLTRGCIPSKILVYPADVIREVAHAEKVGIHLDVKDISWDKISKRMWSQIDESKEMDKSLSHAPNLTIFRGVGEFVGEYQMRVKLNNSDKYSEVFTGKNFILASGARSVIPPIQGLDSVGYVTSESFFGDKFPKHPWHSLIIIGGGIIAAEFAHIFSAFGTDVTIVEMLPRLVSTEEPQISALFENEFRKNMSVYTNSKAISIRKEGKSKVLTVENTETGEQTELSAEEVLVATGCRSNSDLLHPENAGIELDPKGWIPVNEYLETNVPNIWAIGDATGKYQFRHEANYDARNPFP